MHGWNNLDDLHQYRPGIRATELDIISPLAECHTKTGSTEDGSWFELSSSDTLFSLPATRLPYHTLITKKTEKLKKRSNCYVRMDFL
ncbi:MAG: hypothetical protein ACLSCV_03535 [Acutalibacteraceae bacterium]